MGTIQLSIQSGNTLGTDPELFVGRMAGKRFEVVGSEKFVPESSLMVTRDGVQCELHAGGPSYSCRQAFSGSVTQAMAELAVLVDYYNKDGRRSEESKKVFVSFTPLIKLNDSDMKKLSPDARLLNCRDSLNAYGREKIVRDGNTYMIRSGSGHIHLGSAYIKQMDAVELVKFIDLVAGTAIVLMARNKAEKIRRETYGRAGEYRLPKHGLEYRVPSNFWLLDYALASGVTGLVRLAYYIAQCGDKGNPAKVIYDGLLNDVEKVGGWDAVERAINENDWDLALRIHKLAVRPHMEKLYGLYSFGGGVMMDNFEYFVHTIREEETKKDAKPSTHPGLGQWFNTTASSILSRWRTGNRSTGWEVFLERVVGPKRVASKWTGIVLPPAEGTAKRRSGSVETAERRIAA